MRKLALDDDILLEIEKPARYIGGEVNAVMKNVEDIDVRFAMCFPDVYEIGMSHLGIQILYDMFNRREDVWCERVYSPWTDLDKVMREQHIPLFALESQDPIKTFDFLGITIQYEMCYTNILQVLELGQIPMHAKERTEEDPIVIGGGPCAYNPEPLAEFFDLFYIGEGETVVSAIAVNKKGIPSLPVKKTYTVELPIEDAPAVSPSTGQYESATQIEIKVPEGYEAYYTMDKSDPTTASTKYVGPIDMPEGETIFKAILVNAKGRTSGVTTRNYVLELSQGE